MNTIEFSCSGIEGKGQLNVDADAVEAIYFAAQMGTPIDIDGTLYKVKSVVIRGHVTDAVGLLQISNAPHLLFEKV